ncbi:MAG: hypothetical protein ACRD03_17035 [Acidimicrobiales bacterium]
MILGLTKASSEGIGPPWRRQQHEAKQCGCACRGPPSPGRWDWPARSTPAALRALFCGKHPRTGTYLASARGSSARAGARAA